MTADDRKQAETRVSGAPAHTAMAHAPALLGAQAPGLQGAVWTWKPDLVRLRRASILQGTGAVAAAALGLYCWVGLHLGLLAMFLLLPVEVALGSLSITVSHRRRPQLIATDDAGIGITTGSGTRVFLWEEINGCYWDRFGTVMLATSDTPSMFLQLVGYSRSRRRDLARLIRARSGLRAERPTASPAWREPGWFLRPGYSVSSGAAVLPTALVVSAGHGDPQVVLAGAESTECEEWRPSRLRLAACAAGWLMAAGSAAMVAVLGFHAPPSAVPGVFGVLAIPVVVCLMFVLDPAVITYVTNGNGITRGSTLSARRLRWSDVEGMEIGRLGLSLRTSDRVTLLLCGHPARQVQRLVRVVAERAHLAPCPENPKRYLSAGALAALPPGR